MVGDRLSRKETCAHLNYWRNEMDTFSRWHNFRRWIAFRIYPEIFEWYYGPQFLDEDQGATDAKD
ncbi:hypothetical protein LCGC14_1168110 [marine sediment metagenome]|uniref:Uncharacterized protein n=1 Tax=marine sediment metagenome TaxID=412755 RepID=A0A0F9LVJ9_9ZZZZ